MKIKNIAITLITLGVLASCVNHGGSSLSISSLPINEHNAQTMVDKLKDGFGLKGNYTWNLLDQDFNITTPTYFPTNNIYIDDDEYYLYQEGEYGDSTIVTIDAHYLKDETTGGIVQQYLNYENKIISEVVPGAEGALFDEYYVNPFKKLSGEDFTYLGDNTYKLNILNHTSNAIIPYILMFYQTNAFEVKEMTIVVDDNDNPLSLHLVTFPYYIFEADQRIYVQVIFDGNFANREEFANIDIYPYEDNLQTTKIREAFDYIKSTGNYTMRIDHEIVSPSTDEYYTEVLVTKEGIYARDYEVNGTARSTAYGYMTDEAKTGVYTYNISYDSLRRPIINQETLPVTSVTLDYFLSDLQYSEDLFTYSQQSYSLIEDAPTQFEHLLLDYNYVNYISGFAPNTYRLSLLDNHEIEYQYTYRVVNMSTRQGNRKVSISNVGTTTLDDVLKNARIEEIYVPTNYEELLATRDTNEQGAGYYFKKYNEVLKLDQMGKTLDDILPFYFPEVGYKFDSFGTSNTMARLGSNSTIRGKEDTYRYVDEFIALLGENWLELNMEDYITPFDWEYLYYPVYFYQHQETKTYMFFLAYDEYFYLYLYPEGVDEITLISEV